LNETSVYLQHDVDGRAGGRSVGPVGRRLWLGGRRDRLAVGWFVVRSGQRIRFGFRVWSWIWRGLDDRVHDGQHFGFELGTVG